MIPRPGHVLLVLCVVAGLAGCSRNRGMEMLTAPPFEGRSYGLYPGPGVDAPDRYRIGVGDVLNLRMRNHSEFEGKVEVDATGRIMIPLTLDEVEVVGLTLKDAGALIAENLRKYVVKEPRVVVQLESANSRFVYVLGAVAAPGKYAMEDERLYVREAVQRAGWPLRVAALNRTKLVSSSPERAAARCIRLKEVMYRGDLTQNYEMKPGDIVYVPYSYISEFVWYATEILRPFTMVVNYDRTAADLSDIPTASDNNNGGNRRTNR